jgi:hypothetical protein
MTLLEHAQAELALVNPDVCTPRMAAAIAELCDATVDHYDSGGSAPYGAAIAADLFRRVFNHEPLTPIEDLPTDWIEVADGPDAGTSLYQHRRYGGLFKDGPTGRPYALDRVVWTEIRIDLTDRRVFTTGYCGWDSKRYVTLPWTPSEPRRIWHRLRWPNRAIARLSGRLVTA